MAIKHTLETEYDATGNPIQPFSFYCDNCGRLAVIPKDTKPSTVETDCCGTPVTMGLTIIHECAADREKVTQ